MPSEVGGGASLDKVGYGPTSTYPRALGSPALVQLINQSAVSDHSLTYEPASSPAPRTIATVPYCPSASERSFEARYREGGLIQLYCTPKPDADFIYA